MIDTASKKVQINQIVRSQLPSFVQEENPLFVDFLSQYYLSQEYQGGPIDLITNFNEYQKTETFSGNENLIGFTTCTSAVASYDDTINVTSTDGWPKTYGLLKIGNEIITYTGITTNSFTGCIRGFSGIENLHQNNNEEKLLFNSTSAENHVSTSRVENLSNLFLREFWKKTKNQFLPGFEDRKLDNAVDKANFLRQAKDFYASKGTNEAIKILFNVLYNKRAEIVKPIEYLFTPSNADYVVTDDLVAELISGNPLNINGQTLYQTDSVASGSLFNIQRYRKNDIEYYILSLSRESELGTFVVTGSSTLLSNVSIGDTVITVDSTLGFGNTGSVYVGTGQTVGIATYTSKSSNQFFGLTGITSAYSDGQFVRGSRTVYAYENGDITKPVYFRLTSVVSDLDLDNVGYLYVNDKIKPKNLGNLSASNDYRLNSWLHNLKTKTRVAKDSNNKSIIDTITNNVSTADAHLLRVDDSVTLVDESSAIASNVVGTVSQIISDFEFKITVTSGTLDVDTTYSVRRDLSFASANSSSINISEFLANVQNTYSNLDNDKFYVTSGSLPSYEVFATDRTKTFTSSNVSGTTIDITSHRFFTGDVVKYYSVGGTDVDGLTSGSDYTLVKISDNKISLANSKTDANLKRYISLDVSNSGTDHKIVPTDLSGNNLQYQNFLREFSVTPKPKKFEKTFQNETIGMFLNGVEIHSNKSGDVVYYGSLENIDVENGGSGYDLINPPNVHIDDSVGSGATAFAVIEDGSFKSIDVTYRGFDIKKVPSVEITGGNGSGAKASVRLRLENNSKKFDADTGVNTSDDKIEFPSNHLFFNGESVIYKKSSEYAAVGGLVDESLYYVHKVDDTNIQLMNTRQDAFTGNNPITLTSKSAGTNVLTTTTQRNVVDTVIIEDPGSGYSNRKTTVDSVVYPPTSLSAEIRSGINTSDNYIYFRDHGFNSGDLVEYSTTDSEIGGLSQTLNYRVIKVDDDKFRVANAGVGTTSSTLNYIKNNYVDFTSIGVGTHTFKYPQIHVSIDVISGVANTSISTPTVNTICTGSIRNVHLTSVGTGYGVTETLNLHRRPSVTISNGTDAELDPVVINGEIDQVLIKNGGTGYVTPPTLRVDGVGKYAKLVATVTNGAITSVTVVDRGKSFVQGSTSIKVIPVGSGAKLRADVKKWEVDFVQRYKKTVNENDDGIIVPSQNSNYGNKFVHGYLSRKLRRVLGDNVDSSFGEESTPTHSPIVGWAYDGSPIYGPYGYNTATGGTVRRLLPSYTLETKSNRPSVTLYPLGFFVNDWNYTADGDLDEYNGRFCKTPEYPEGVYAYFCNIEVSNSSTIPFSNNREPLFPYILNGFKFEKNEFNENPLSIQNLPLLNSGNLVRNTYPYKLRFGSSKYDYFVTNNLEETELTVKSINPIGISTVSVIDGGDNYKIGDKVVFDNDESGGNSLLAKVKTIVGRGITEISYSETSVSNIAFTYENQIVTGIATTSHGLSDNDVVFVTGIGTGELKFIEGPRTISVSSITAKLDVGVGTVGDTGVTTSISLDSSSSLKSIDVDDTLVVGSTSERLRVLSIDKTNNKYRVIRNSGISTSHAAGELLVVDQRKFSFEVGIKTNLSINADRKVVFNPQNSIGVGTASVNQTVTGVGVTTVVRVVANDGTILTNHELPPTGSTADNSITIVDHGFRTGEKLLYKNGLLGIALTVSPNLNLSNPFDLVDGQTVFAVNKGKDLLGITTTLTGIGTTATSLYFLPVKDNTGTEHSFTTQNKKYSGSVKRYDVTVGTSTNHGLLTNDEVTVYLVPTSTISKSIEYDTQARRTIVDPKYFETSAVGVGTSSSIITIDDHDFESGEKVLYISSNPASPLINKGEYYVKKIDDNRFRLSTNYIDSINFNSNYVGITTFGSGTHKIAKINPKIAITRGRTIGFAVSDSSLTDLRLEFFEDQNFINRYNGFGISTEVTRTGTPGSSGAIVNLTLSDNVPPVLYYKLVPTNLDTISVDKRDANPDLGVVNGSVIELNNSVYSGSFNVKKTGDKEYKYQVKKEPEASSYTSSGISTFRYVTKSTSAIGPINEISVKFPGSGYVSPPGITTVQTTDGSDAVLRVFSDKLGNSLFDEITKIGFDYPSDKTLKPTADIPSFITVSKNYKISEIGVVTTGRNYLTPPDVIVFGRSDIQLRANLDGTSIGSIDILSNAAGFDNIDNPARIIPIRNSNGVGVVTASSNGDTNFLTLTQPTNGWKPDGSDFPFAVGDIIFVENVNTVETSFNTTGGYNSENYDYSFFTIASRTPTTSQITYSIVGLGTTGGTFDLTNSAGKVIKQSDLPTFSVELDVTEFFAGEIVNYSSDGIGKVSDNKGYDSVTNTLRIERTNSDILNGDVIRGSVSGAEATVVDVKSYDRVFETGYKSQRPKGWQNDSGKLNDNFQRLQDNDYYQNFAYSIKSEVQELTWEDPVDSIIHPAGYKRFCDLIVPSSATAGFGRSNTLEINDSGAGGAVSLLVQIDNLKTFYEKDDFDIATEETLANGLSKFILFGNRTITDGINIVSNRVELIDDISGEFTGIGTTTSAKVVGLTSFKLSTLNGTKIPFNKIFDGSDSSIVSTGSSIIRINNHDFQTGEKFIYDPGDSVYGSNRIGIETTNNVVGGVSTDFLPKELFAIKIDNNNLKLAGLSTTASSNDPLVFRSVGSGTSHSFDVITPFNRVIIEIDNIIQSPLYRKNIGVALTEAVGVGSTTIKVVGVTSIVSNNLLQIDDEIIRINVVGFGSTNVLEVERAVLGSVAAAHTVGAAVTMMGGDYRILKDVIHFVSPPYGPTGVSTLQPGISTYSSFAGRIFYREDPSTNFIFDDVSDRFTGVGKTFTLLQNTQDTTGIVTTKSGGGGDDEVINNGVVLINNIFQRPTIDYSMTERQSPGIGASVIFTGSDREDLPRGGIVKDVVVGFGSGYQNLVAAAATAVINAAGAIESVVVTGGGSGYRSSDSVSIQVLNPLGIGSTAVLSATVGTAGTVSGISTVSGGSGYASTNPPTIVVGIATGYANMSFTGGQGSGFEATVTVGTGGSIIDFDITNRGIGYGNGDVLTVAGIPTDPNVGVAFSTFTFTVDQTTDDEFAGYSFGQLLPLHNFSDEFDGTQTSFTIRRAITKTIVNFTTDDPSIDIANNFILVLNDVVQKPGENYILESPTKIKFTEAPKSGSKFQILFFRGSNKDLDAFTAFATVKIGDELQLQRQDNYQMQLNRVITDIVGIDKVETNLYGNVGINTDPNFERAVSWTKQTSDLILNGQPLSKARDSLIAKVQPTTRIIQNVGVSSDQIFVENAFPLFSAYDNRSLRNNVPGKGIKLIRENNVDRASATATVSSGGTISSVTITDGGFGYLSAPTVSFATTYVQSKEIGKTWTQATSNTDIEYNSVAHVNGVFIAVGSTSGINTSIDGITWSDSGVSGFGTFFGVDKASNTSTSLIAVGLGGTIAISTDASTFDTSTIFNRTLNGFIFSFANTTISANLNDYAGGQTKGVAVGAGGTILFTEQGASGFGTAFVVADSNTTNNLHGVGSNQDTFIAVGDAGTILRSTNGETWSGAGTASVTTRLNDVYFDDNQWIAVGAAGTIIQSTDNGLNWSIVSSGSTFNLNSVYYADNVWVAVGQTGMVMNSVDGTTWYKKFIGVGTDYNGLAYVDQQLVTVGLSSNIAYSTFETVSAAATATVSAAGTISAITISDGGFGFDSTQSVGVILSLEPVTIETITSVECEGDFGYVVGVGTSATGIGTDSPMVKFELDSSSFLNQAGFGNIARSGIQSGYYFVITGSIVGNGLTSITIENSAIGVGTTFIDNVYRADQVINDGTSGIVTVYSNVESLAGLGTTSLSPKIGNYSWGRFYNFTRDPVSPGSFTINNQNGYTGLTTAPIVNRILKLSENYSDFTETL
jgi:hypothetical protein